MTRAVAQGTFDLLHPGHVHYLEDAATRRTSATPRTCSFPSSASIPT